LQLEVYALKFVEQSELELTVRFEPSVPKGGFN
jgi:hypothetical protein